MKTDFKLILRSDLPSKDGQSRIDVRVQLRGKQIKLSTIKKVKLQYWDSNQQRVLTGCKDAQLINKYLSRLMADINAYKAKKEVLDEEINLDDIRAIIRGKEKALENHFVPLSEIFDKYIQKLQLGTNRYNTLRNVRSTKKLTIEFARSKYKREPTIDLISFNFLENYKAYLKIHRGNKDVSINKRLRHLRTVVRYALKLGYKMSYPFDGLKISQGEPKCIYLTKFEYEQFKGIKLGASTPNQMKLSKDLFIFGCETGLRYCDIISLTWENVDEDLTIISKPQTKSNREVNVPISALAREIISLWGKKDDTNLIFPKASNQKLNEYLKVLANRAGIEKHITFHVSRHTFASHVAMVLSPAYVMKLIGDKDMRMVNVYINADKTDLMDAMVKHWNNVV